VADGRQKRENRRPWENEQHGTARNRTLEVTNLKGLPEMCPQ
jgi:hypothetical protein